MIAPTPIEEDANTTGETWAEHQRRQRSIRTLMMFLMMLILMDGEEPHNKKKSLRGRNKKGSKGVVMEENLWKERRRLDLMLWEAGKQDDRLSRLIELNHGDDEESIASIWARDSALNESVGGENNDGSNKTKGGEENDVQAAKAAFNEFQEKERLVYHYPRNVTGSYRGEWTKVVSDHPISPSISAPISQGHTLNSTKAQVLSDEQIIDLLPPYHIGVHVLPPNNQLDEIFHKPLKENGNSTTRFEQKLLDSAEMDQPLDISKDEGSIIIRLYTRTIAGMTAVSLVDGIVNLYDVNDRSFTSNLKHLTLRVRGIVVHSIGKVSLVANDDPLRSALVVKNGNIANHRKLFEKGLQSAVENQAPIEAIRDEALKTNHHLFNEDVGGENWIDHFDYGTKNESRNLQNAGTIISNQGTYVGANPFLPDDEDNKLSLTPANILRASPPLTLQNGQNCEFELDFNITETKWTIAEWRQMLKKLMMGLDKVDPANANKTESVISDKRAKKGTPIVKVEPLTNHRDEAVVMHMLGTIRSAQCNFASNVNVTAVRTDWEQTTAKAVNYCFFMMVCCFAQTIFLLKQLLHSQPQSVAVSVSLISVGWQTILDAILCVEHILLCMLLQPISTAFAMVGFLKLLIFCVIEMRYMITIMQARLNAAGVNVSTTELRRKVTGLHFRFYFALMFAIFSLWQLRQTHRTLCVLIMYGFWVPQIIQNIVTETKKPLLKNFVYGMTVTRLFAPLYTLGVPNNFFTEVEPDFPVDYFSCQVLVIWLSLQAAILIGQANYGARFMIPARFLPPKFDYSRPIPDHMIPKTTLIIRKSSNEEESASLLENDTTGPRKRKEKRSNNGITTINHTESCERPTLDCVICYNDIDIGDRMGYMLASCNHIFHRQCLTQWMDVKMECPVCRTDLPAL